MLSQFLAGWTGLQIFEARIFRAGAAAVTAAALVMAVMPFLIRLSLKWKASADFTDLGPPPPSILGGMLVIPAILFSTLLFAHINSNVVSILIVMLGFSAVGAVDDVAKILTHRAVMLGAAARKDYQDKADGLSVRLRLFLYFAFSLVVAVFAYKFIPGMDGYVTIPFIKPQIWYPYLPNWAFVILIVLVITSTANGANFTDGLDSLVSVPIITTSVFVGLVAYISGNAVFAGYFLIPHLPGVDELFPLCAAITGAMGAYLWYNSPPAQIYLGDSGSIGLGGGIGMMFILIKAELFLPIVGFVFLGEAVSVFLQITWFKCTRRLLSQQSGRRLFLRAPIHHHFQIKWKNRFPEIRDRNSKIAWRFHLVSIFCLLLGLLIFFKMR